MGHRREGIDNTLHHNIQYPKYVEALAIAPETGCALASGWEENVLLVATDNLVDGFSDLDITSNIMALA